MKKELNDLENKIANFEETDFSEHKKFASFVENSVIILTAGGEGTRFRNLLKDSDVNKSAFVLPNSETMIERTIKMYKNVGFKDFVILVYYQADSIVNLLKDGSKYGVNIRYSYDPGKAVGRGGAIKNAMLNGLIENNKYFIVHNPDDQIVGDTSAIMKLIISSHLHNEDKGAMASAVVVKGANFEFSGMKVEKGLVSDIETYPFIPVPCHVGITVFSPSVNNYFDRLFDLEKKCDFEPTLFPILSKEKKLYACKIPVESWISVNNEKGFKRLIKNL